MNLTFELPGGEGTEPVEIPTEPSAVIRAAGKIRAVDLAGRRTGVRAIAAGGRIYVWCEGDSFSFIASSPGKARSRGGAREAGLRAPMPGKILRVLVHEGEEVIRGTTLLILEAMKMEHEIKAPRAGRISGMPFSTGDQVEAGAKLVEFAP